jgi:lipopolysaccharide/colanic/teichoic acid biosynthesis glycosyltransferase
MSKRVLDLCGASLALLASLPLLLAVVVAIKLESPGPVLFTQRRVGRGGRLFRLYKFRSMIVGSESGPAITGKADPRTTRIGRLIRPLRLDELPQLLNVLKGDMSLVGPRPEAPEFVAAYTAEQRQVLALRPGITGPTQLAWLGESDWFPADVDPAQYYIRTMLPEKLQSDLRYLRTRTLVGDLGDLILTPVRLAELVLARPRAETRSVVSEKP